MPPTENASCPVPFAEKTATPLRCLVAGGLGYTGAWITRQLAEVGHTVYALSRRNQKTDLGVDYTLIQGDPAVLSPEALASLIPDDINCVVHARGFDDYTSPDASREALLVNAFGTRNMLEAVRLKNLPSDTEETGKPLPVFICISTTHVYGRAHGVINEGTVPEPNNDFALTHYFSEEYCRMHMRKHSLPTIVLRLSNCYGAPKSADRTRWELLLGSLCLAAANGKSVTMRSSPSALRDFVWLGDVARAVTALAGRRDLAGSTFNVASGTAQTIGHVAELVTATASRYYNRVIPLIHEENAVNLPQRGRTPELRVSNAAIRNATGMTFHDQMKEEIVSTLRFLEQQQ